MDFSCLPHLLEHISKISNTSSDNSVKYSEQGSLSWYKQALERGECIMQHTVFIVIDLSLSSVRLALSRTRLLTRAAKGFMCRSHSKSGDSIGESENENKDYIPLVSLYCLYEWTLCQHAGLFECDGYKLMADNLIISAMCMNYKNRNIIIIFASNYLLVSCWCNKSSDTTHFLLQTCLYSSFYSCQFSGIGLNDLNAPNPLLLMIFSSNFLNCVEFSLPL